MNNVRAVELKGYVIYNFFYWIFALGGLVDWLSFVCFINFRKRNKMPRSVVVQAIIYDQDGRLLLQYRDNVAGIREANIWGFFGCGVEEGETLTATLGREFQEQLSCEVGEIEKELFRCDRCSNGVLNVFFSVRFTASNDDFFLMERKGFAWFSLWELVGLPLSSLVYENMPYLLRITSKADFSADSRLEQAILKHGKLCKKNERVFYAQETPVVLGVQIIMLMKGLAEFKGQPVFRVCLHESADEGIHEMLMVHTRPAHTGPHKQDKTSLSYHMLDGVADISLYDDTGVCDRTIRLDSNDNFGGRFVRLKANVFRSLQTRSQYSVFLEVASGPFADDETVWMNK
jgi:cupin fold WbuC family metalloprotein